MLVVRPLIEEQKPKGKAFLLTGKFSPYTIGHHEVARQTAAHAAESGYTHFYHGIGGASKQTESDPFTHAQKTKVIRAAHKELAKAHPSVKFRTTKKEQLGPFHQLTHLAKQGHKHITVGLAAGHKLKGEIEGWVKKNKGIKDETGKVHDVKVDFHQLGAERQEGEMPRHEVLGRLKQGDIRVAKATRLRKAVASGDTELAHELMPKHVDKSKYFNLIKKAQSKIPAKKTRKKKLTEGLLSFSEFIAEAPELDPYIDAYIDASSGRKQKFGSDYLKSKERTYHLHTGHKFIKHENLGDIHPDYELHRHVSSVTGHDRGKPVHVHQYSIVHKKSGDVAGEIDASAGKIHRKTGEHTTGTGKGLKISWVGVHPDHSSKRAGTSLPIAAYKHLHKLGHSIKSDTTHSFGGAHVWDRLRNDPDVKHHVKYHDEKDNKAVPAHKLYYGDIWQEHPSGQETTLVLHAKPRQKKAVTEDIELIPVQRDRHPEKPRKAADVHKGYATKDYSSDKIVTKKNLGEIHPGYDLHHHSRISRDHRGRDVLRHQFTIVHRASGDVAGEMNAKGGKLHPTKGVVPGPKGKGLKVTHLEVHPDHSSKKVGTSLAVEMYRHLHRRGHAIQSDAIQSHGAAHVWNTMRNDRELKKHMMIHSNREPLRGELHTFEKRAHRRPERHIWYQHSRNWSAGREKVEGSHGDEPDEVRTLVLSGKKQRKKMNEAPELDAYIDPGGTKKEPFNVSYLKKKRHTFDSKSFVGHKRMGDIHPKYEMWRHTTELTDDKGNKYHQHQFSIVHKDTRKKVGEIDAVGGKINRKTGEHRAGTGKDLKISYLGIHDQHSAKKVGTSLAVAAYKHLHKKGRSIKSDTRQSFGGAHVWDTLRNDPEVKRHVKFHDERDNTAIPAHKLPYGGIWQENPSASDTTLVLHKKRKKKVVAEDIEMSNVMGKPWGGFHRDFSRVVNNPWVKKPLDVKRSGRIAKGYTLHTIQDPDDLRIQRHYVVHDDTNHVAGEIHTHSSPMTGEHHVVSTEIHGDHTKKKIGKSLAILAYKHLARKKGNLHSSNLQSPGGASIWNRLRKDPRMKGKIFHKSKSGQEVPAHDLPDKQIWASETKVIRSKGTPQYLPKSSRHAEEHEKVLLSRLVIRPAKKS